MPVGKKKPSPWGLFDIHGNVAEWCLDHYVADAYKQYPTDKPTLGPVILPDAKEYPYVARGGSWDDDATLAPLGGPPRLQPRMERSRSPTAPEHLVAYRRDIRRIPDRPAPERARKPQGPQVASRQGQDHTLIRRKFDSPGHLPDQARASDESLDPGSIPQPQENAP